MVIIHANGVVGLIIVITRGDLPFFLLLYPVQPQDDATAKDPAAPRGLHNKSDRSRGD